jgi:hypothetical protein
VISPPAKPEFVAGRGLELRGITKRYGDLEAIRDLSFDVRGNLECGGQIADYLNKQLGARLFIFEFNKLGLNSRAR